MEFLSQRHWFTSIIKQDEQHMIALTDYMDNQIERRVGMEVEISSLQITAAWFDKLGRPGNMAEERIDIEGLPGIVAYLGSGRQLKAALQNTVDELERSLFNDCVIGVVQAETFLYPLRGYEDADSYNSSWENGYAGSCRYYSNLELVENSWVDFIGAAPRRANLFSRSKSQQLIRDEQGNQFIIGSLVDSFHQMASHLKLDPAGKVIEARGQVLRAPDQVCFPAAAYMQKLLGVSLKGKNKKEIAGLLGTGQGCVHLIDLVYDSVQTLERYKGD